MEQILDGRPAERQSVPLSEAGQPPRGGSQFRLRRLFGQTITQHIERLVERFLFRLRQALVDRLTEQLLLFGSQKDRHRCLLAGPPGLEFQSQV